MVRAPSCDKTGLKKGAWTPEEDTKLIAYITRYGTWNWRLLPRFAGLARCGKSCRLRWLNYLRPNIKRGNYTEEEEKTIIRLHEKLGNKWSVIATHLPGRTDNEIKNHWHTTLKKHFVKNTVGSENGTKSKQERDSPTTSLTSDGPFSPLSSSSQFSSIDASSEILSGEDGFNFEDVNENMWTESYLSDICYAPLETVPDFQGSDTTGSPHAWELDQYLVPENDHLTLLETTQQTTEIFWTQPYVPDMSHVPNELLVPLLNESDEYLLPMYDVDLWSQSNSHACLFQ